LLFNATTADKIYRVALMEVKMAGMKTEI